MTIHLSPGGARRHDEDLVLLLADLYFQTSTNGKAVDLLDDAASKDTSNYNFPYTKGLIYQKREQYQKAIDAYKEALALAPGATNIDTHIGTCYYNVGVEIEKQARTMTNKRAVTREKERSAEAFEMAITWFKKALEKDPDNQYIITKLNQLYSVLGVGNKKDNMKGMLHSSSPRN